MEGINRSGRHSGGVVKNRSSSGCLIIKKKSDGVSGVGSSKSSKLHESKKEKKRPRLNDSDVLSSDEELLELYPKRGERGMKQIPGASLVYEDNDFEDGGFNRDGLMPKRSKLDIYDFDEYDDLSDVEVLRMRHYHDRGIGGGERRFSGVMPVTKNGSGLDLESGSSKGDIIYKRRNSFHAGSSIEKIKSGDLYSGKRRFEMRSEVPVTMGKEAFGGPDDAIRLQGKNGVLKVRVKHKEDISEQFSHNYIQVKGNNVTSRSQELTSKNISIRPSPYLEKNLLKKPMAVDRIDKNQHRKREPQSAESSEESDEEAEDSDLPPKLQTNNVKVHQSAKRGRSGGSTHASQKVQPNKLKEGKVKRGSGTEKQLLREKIRSMLVNAGWTIDYRPRRGRDYFDAVYVNPTGTAYWSIIKAYDALQKQLEEEGNSMKASVESSSFAPISEDVLSKLTRQTRKKIEKELKRKKREEAGVKRKKEFACGNFDEDESDTDSGGSGRHDDKLSSFMKRSGKSLKGALEESNRDGSNFNSKMQERGEKSSLSNRFIHARKSKKIGRCMLLVRNSGKGLDIDSDGFVPYTGKRNLLSWLIDSGTVKLSEKVHYMNRRCTRVMLEGWITREGIHCSCCSKILTVSKFEIHAASKLRLPYQNIYMSSGASLMQCQVDAWNRQEESLRNGYNKIDVSGDDPNDDTCAICGDGGNLICCDSCPSTFHQNCLGIEMLPAGDWHCPHCSCKFCGLADMSVTEGNDRIQDTVLTCSLCEGKYHCSCVEEMEGTPFNSNSPPFCGKTCQEVSEQLQKLLGVKHELEAGLFWSLIHRTELGSDTSVRGFSQRVEWNSKLAVALTVMDECFLPIIDRRSGINMIHSVLYNSGSNITRLNYSGFYTAILEKGDEIVAAASIRIRGTEFAEMPFIGTRHIYRRQGMCRRLFSAIELALRSLKVEKLIIPAISELMDTWTTVFGFCTLEESDKHAAKIGNMLVFPGTDMLQKKLLDLDSFKRGLAGADSFENNLNASLVMPGLRKKCDLYSSPEPPSAAAEPQNGVMKGTPVTDFGSQDMVCTDGTSLDDASIDHCGEVKPPFPAENENTDECVSEFGFKDVICTNERNLHSASVDCFRGSKPLPSENEEMKDKSDTGFGSENMVCADGNSLHAAADYCEVKMPSLTENNEIKDEFVTDFGSEDIVFTDGNSLLGTSTDCEEVKPPSPTENEEMKEKSVSGCCKEAMPSLPTENEEIKDKAITDLCSQAMVSTKEKNLHRASADCCAEGKPSLPTASSCDLNDDKSIVNDEMKDTSKTDFGSEGVVIPNEKFASSASVHCSKEDEPSLHTACAAVSGEVDSLNEGSLGTTSSELQLDNKSDVDVKANASAGRCETGSFLDYSAARHDVEVSFDYKLTHGASMSHVDSGSSIADGMLVATSGNGMLNDLQRNDNEAQSDGILSSKNESAVRRKDLFLLEVSHVDLEMKRSLIEPLVENNIHRPLEVEVDNSLMVSAEIDGCSGSPSLRVSDCISDAAHEPTIHFSGNDTICSQIIEEMPLDAYAYRPEQNESVVIEKHQLHSFGEITEPSLEGEVKHVEVANVLQNSSLSCEISVSTVLVNTPNSEDLPCTFGDGGIGVTGLLPASEHDDQGTI